MKMARIVSIMLILLEKKRIGAQELADQFEVSRRTIYRDIDTLNLAGIPIHAISGTGGGFEIMPQYKLNQKVFSATDLTALLLGLTGLSSMGLGDELVHTLAKVKSFIPPDKAQEFELQANQIQIDLNPWLMNRNSQPFLELIKTALQESHLLTFDYIDRYGQKTMRIAEPYQLVLKNSHWYLYGYCQKRQAFRLFRLSRMVDLKSLTETFTPRSYQKNQFDFTEQALPLQTEIKIRFHQSIMDQMLEYCTYAEFLPADDQHYVVRFPFFENDFYYNLLLGFGTHCECLEPRHVRVEIKRRIQALANLYKD